MSSTFWLDVSPRDGLSQHHTERVPFSKKSCVITIVITLEFINLAMLDGTTLIATRSDTSGLSRGTPARVARPKPAALRSGSTAYPRSRPQAANAGRPAHPARTRPYLTRVESC